MHLAKKDVLWNVKDYMSIKIYDAYRTEMPLSKLMETLRIKKLEIQNKAIEFLAEYYKIESYLEREKEEKFFFYHDILREKILPDITNAIISPYHTYHAIDCVVVLYFHNYKKFPKKNIILQPFGGWSHELKFDEIDGFYDFHYQNQSDMPEEVSLKDWNLREKVWNNIFNDYNFTPCEAGLAFDMINISNISTILNGVDEKYRELKIKYEKEKINGS